MEEIGAILDRLQTTKFRAKFSLRGRDKAVVDLRGIVAVRRHAEDFVAKRLAPAFPDKDGRQTPYRGHPVFVAQHATATCCRTCLYKWHHIVPGAPLTVDEQGYVVNVIIAWIERQYAPGKPPV